jgi:glyoxylate reductase
VAANCAVGFDNVDLAAATAAGVCITNTPDVLTEATAELAFTLMLACARRITEGERLVRSGGWTGWRLDQLLGIGLAGKTLGIVGFGRIGRAMARLGAAFGMRVIYADPLAPPADAPAEPAAPGDPVAVSMSELFTTADAISLHCPLTPETRHLVNTERLATMKPTAILVNTARGGCIDDDALAAALRRGAIFGAALDVYAREPEIPAALLDCPRLVLAPHIGSATLDARTRMAQLCADAVIAALTGRRPPNLLNKDVNPSWMRRS